MTFKYLFCKGLLLLRMHHPSCDRCNDLQGCRGLSMRRRLQELNWENTNRKARTLIQSQTWELQPMSPANSISSDTELATEKPPRKTG